MTIPISASAFIPSQQKIASTSSTLVSRVSALKPFSFSEHKHCDIQAPSSMRGVVSRPATHLDALPGCSESFMQVTSAILAVGIGVSMARKMGVSLPEISLPNPVNERLDQARTEIVESIDGVLRMPQEPDPIRYAQSEGVRLTPSLDFAELEALYGNDREAIEQAMQAHAEECIALGLQLTTAAYEPFKPFIDTVKTMKVPVVDVTGEKHRVEVKVESVKIAGVPDEALVGIRHTVKLPINAEIYFDAVSRLIYSDKIDSFAYSVEQLEEIRLPGSQVTWGNVVHMQDNIGPILFDRDFVTFGAVSEPNLMISTRSCQRPDCEPTEVPSVSALGEGRQYRVPLQYFHRVIPDKDDPNACTVVQFQFSDVGGIAPPQAQTDSVVRFGVDSIANVLDVIALAKRNGVDLGPGSEGYMVNPLNDGWSSKAEDIIEGLSSNKLKNDFQKRTFSYLAQQLSDVFKNPEELN